MAPISHADWPLTIQFSLSNHLVTACQHMPGYLASCYRYSDSHMNVNQTDINSAYEATAACIVSSDSLESPKTALWSSILAVTRHTVVNCY